MGVFLHFRDVVTFLDAIEDIVDEQDLTQESELHVQQVHQIERRNDATVMKIRIVIQGFLKVGYFELNVSLVHWQPTSNYF